MDIVYFHFDTQVFFGEFYGLYDGEAGVPFAAAADVFFYGFQGLPCYLVGKTSCSPE